MQNRGGVEDLLQTYLTKCDDIQIQTEINRSARTKVLQAEFEVDLHQLAFDLDPFILDLDELSTLHRHNRLVAQSKVCLERQVEYNARERVIHTKLDEIAALEAEIMANYGSELNKIDRSIRTRFAAQKTTISLVRLERLSTHWRRVSGRL